MDVVQGDLKNRTKRFALEIIKLVQTLPRGRTAEVLTRQLLRAGTSAGANYRSACRARSIADFISKMGIVEEELDETIYWMELLVESGILKFTTVELLVKEADELLSITVASINTAKRRTR
ncbi:MAG TPA: four helix bundle protein [Thermodesulfobacteriota bacterium]|nr:four helix bundle protein [Thermodesulfobacteriota bacterium]